MNNLRQRELTAGHPGVIICQMADRQTEFTQSEIFDTFKELYLYANL